MAAPRPHSRGASSTTGTCCSTTSPPFELAATARERLAGLSGLDLVPLQWLHVTTYIAPFADEVSDREATAMVEKARRLLRGVAPCCAAA